MNAQMQEENKCGLAAEILQTRGTLRLRAMGTSMLPTLWPGDVVTVKVHNFERVQSGEVVLCLREGRLFLHRVVKKSDAGKEPFLLTRGDSMPKNDPPVEPDQLLGRIAEIRRNGAVVAIDHKLSPFRLLFARVLGHSNFCQRIALRLHQGDRNSSSGREFFDEQTAW